MATVIKVLIDGETETINLESFWKDVISFGSSTECDIELPKSYVSRLHGCFYYDKGSWHYKDLNSVNGIYKNGIKRPEEPLHEGDELVISESPTAKDCIKISVCSSKENDLDKTDNLKSSDDKLSAASAAAASKSSVLKTSAASTKSDVLKSSAASTKSDVLKSSAASTKSDVLKSGAASTKSDVLKSDSASTKSGVLTSKLASTKSDVLTSKLASTKSDVLTSKLTSSNSSASKPASTPAKPSGGAPEPPKESKSGIFIIIGFVVVVGIVAILGWRMNSKDKDVETSAVAEATTEAAPATTEATTVEPVEEATEATTEATTEAPTEEATASTVTDAEELTASETDAVLYTDDGQLTEQGALEGVKNYYFKCNPEMTGNADAQNSWNIASSLLEEGNHAGCIEIEYVAFNSDSDAKTYYYVDKASGAVAIEEYVDGTRIKSSETFNVKTYLD